MAARKPLGFRELWEHHDSGASICALLNGDRGWLMLLRFEGDSGMSSRNPDYDGPDEAVIEYRLTNGQRDEYPASWALPESVVMRALKHFQKTGKPAPFVTWNED
jgi:hypothetical protein